MQAGSTIANGLGISYRTLKRRKLTGFGKDRER
jgi:hypothetical protein